MKHKKIITSAFTVIVVAIMVGASEILGEKEIIFPEITAIAVGLLIAPKRSWQVNRIRMLIMITVCAILGLMISMFVPLPLWVQMTLAFFISQFIYIFSKTSFAPMISATVLPVMLGTKSIIYPISAVILTGIILLISILLEKTGLKENEAYTPLDLPKKSDYINLTIRSLIACVLILLATKVNFIFSVAPPILVAFTEFSKQSSKARQKPIKAVMLIFICAFIGALCRYILCVCLSLPLTLAAVIATIIMILILNLFKMYLPPAGALTILAMLIPEQYLIIYPIEILLGIGIFMGLSLICFRKSN